MMKKTNNHDVISLFKGGISRTHKVLAASVVLAAGLLYGCSDSEVNEGEAPDPDPTPVESGIETQAITVNNNSADFADRITLYGKEAGSRAATDGEKIKFMQLALVTSPKIEKQHLSATCVFPYNGKAYVCYHLNEAYKDNLELVPSKNVYQGAVELIEYHENWTPDQMIVSQVLNDNQDFNHCIIDEYGTGMMYTTGDMKDGVARLGMIEVGSDGKFLGKDNMSVVPLIGGSGNCVIQSSSSNFYIATSGGFQSLATGETQVNKDNFFATEGSAKFIAMSRNGWGPVTLHLEKIATDDKSAKAVIKKEWGKSAEVLNDTELEITPTNGKNTIAVDDNDGGNIYVCLGENGVAKLDWHGKVLSTYSWKKDHPKSDGCANSVAVDENYVYIAYGGTGLVLLDKATMKYVARYVPRVPKTDENGKPVLDENGKPVNKEYSANYVALVGDNFDDRLIYVAYGRNGLGILKLDKESAGK